MQRQRWRRERAAWLLMVPLLAAMPALAQSRSSGSAPMQHEQQAWFEDVTHKAGVSARHHPRRFDNPYAEIMQGYTRLGAAAAVADFDGDGLEDVFVTD